MSGARSFSPACGCDRVVYRGHLRKARNILGLLESEGLVINEGDFCPCFGGGLQIFADRSNLSCHSLTLGEVRYLGDGSRNVGGSHYLMQPMQFRSKNGLGFINHGQAKEGTPSRQVGLKTAELLVAVILVDPEAGNRLDVNAQIPKFHQPCINQCGLAGSLFSKLPTVNTIGMFNRQETAEGCGAKRDRQDGNLRDFDQCIQLEIYIMVSGHNTSNETAEGKDDGPEKGQICPNGVHWMRPPVAIEASVYDARGGVHG